MGDKKTLVVKSHQFGAVNVRVNGPHRTLTWEGRKQLIVPVVLITEGVHHGSAGRMLYTSEELSKFPQAWNGRPAPIGHPRNESGEPITANDPGVITDHAVGTVWNVAYMANKLRGELWVDVDKAMERAPDVLSELQSGNGRLEVSTGLFFDLIEQQGVFNGEDYEGIVTNIRPDHLALLPGGEGACSWEDGCGAPRVNAQGHTDTMMFSANNGPWRKSALESFKAKYGDNAETSYQEISQRIRAVLDARDVFSGDVPLAIHFLEATFADNFIFRKVTPEGSRLFKQEYSISEDGELTIEEGVVEVREETSFVEATAWPADAEDSDDTKTNNGKEATDVSDKKKAENKDKDKACCVEAVNGLIKSGKFTENDREGLMALPKETLDRMTGLITDNDDGGDESAAEEKPGQEKPGEAAGQQEEEGASGSEEEAPITLEAFVKGAPPELRGSLELGVNEYKNKVAGLIRTILGNKRNTFTQKGLEVKPYAELVALAALAHEPKKKVFAGAGGGGSGAENEDDGGYGAPPMPTLFPKKGGTG